VSLISLRYAGKSHCLFIVLTSVRAPLGRMPAASPTTDVLSERRAPHRHAVPVRVQVVVRLQAPLPRAEPLVLEVEPGVPIVRHVAFGLGRRHDARLEPVAAVMDNETAGHRVAVVGLDFHVVDGGEPYEEERNNARRARSAFALQFG
jgi:hypothetical protein